MMNIQNFSRALVVCLFFAANAFSQNNFQIEESKTEAFFQNNQLVINLAVKNNSALFYGDVRLEVLDTDDKIIAQNNADVTKFTFSKGESFIRIPVNFAAEKSVKELLWYRLRYTVLTGKNSTNGIVSFSEIIPELFNLRVSGSEKIFAGQNYIIRVSAVHPTKKFVIGSVKLAAELKLDVKTDDGQKDLKIKAIGETDAQGLATLEFQIPNDVKFEDDDDSAEIKVSGEKNGLKSFAEEDLESETGNFRVYLNADKPIYQPNQKISVRGLAMSENGIIDGRKIAADKELEFLIKDEEGLVLYRETVKTSRFGIAAIEWQIPDNAKIGTYSIQVNSDENSRSDYINFKVSRYELPNFISKGKSIMEILRFILFP